GWSELGICNSAALLTAPSRRAWPEGCGHCPVAPPRRRPLHSSEPQEEASLLQFSPRASLLASRLDRVVRGRRQNRRPVRGSLLLLHFQFRNKDLGRSGGHGNGSRFRPTVAVEHFRLVPRC